MLGKPVCIHFDLGSNGWHYIQPCIMWQCVHEYWLANYTFFVCAQEASSLFSYHIIFSALLFFLPVYLTTTFSEYFTERLLFEDSVV